MRTDPEITSPSVSVVRTVEWIDTDASGHQHNSVILRWMESAEAEMMRQLDLSEYFPHAPRVRQTVNYTGMLWFGQRAVTRLWIDRVGTTSLTLGFDVVSESMERTDGAPVAHGSVTTVWFPAGATSAQPWPDNMRVQLEGKEQRDHDTQG